MIVLRWIFWLFLRLSLGARYRIRIVGKEQLDGLDRSVLLLPNHPAYIDPFIIFLTFWPRLKMRPLVYAGNFHGAFGRFVIKLFNALEIPDLNVASVQARALAEQSVSGVAEGLKQGDNCSLWPSGHVERRGVERIGAARATADILRQAPEAKVVLIRTRGLRGSSWSYAQTGKQPGIGGRILAGIGWILANLLFFMPRRPVTITLQLVDRSSMPEPKREVLNPWLEKWYNQDTDGQPETPSWVRYHFLFGRRSFDFPPPPLEAELDLKAVRPEIRDEVMHLIEVHLKRPLTDQEKRPETDLESLGLDSLDRMDLSLQIEQRFGFSGDETPMTISHLLVLAQGLAERKPPKPPPPSWFLPSSESSPPSVKGETIIAAFVEQALRCRKDVVVADDLAGALTYEKMLVGALTMARRLKKLDAPNVGLLMPASAACDVALMALYLAGKLPVLLNWTTGPTNLAHAARLTNLTHIVTSKAFIDRTGIAVEGTKNLFLEELRGSIGKFELLRTLLRVRWFPGRVRHKVPHLDPHSPAVVLFTSGSEKAPKAVPLTHANIISDQRAGIPHLGFVRNDIFIGFLPAFHSFGINVTGVLPLLTGMRVVRHPDPTDATNLVRKIAAYKATVLIGTPTFVHHILERSKPEDLSSLRLIVTGAEKAPEALFQRIKEMVPHALFAEGYGITECAPVVTCNPPGKAKPGSIGTPLPGVEVRIVDLESGKIVGPDTMGMIEVSGPTVFPGYLSHEGASPFVENSGKRWYVTGDLGSFDADGYLWFRGRLKRFLKAGGEMISLPALEEPFAKLHPPTEVGPSVAVEGVEQEGKRRIVLFTTRPMNLRDANAVLVQEGFHGVMRLDEVRQIEKIPTLGTGKTDYKLLRAEILKGLT